MRSSFLLAAVLLWGAIGAVGEAAAFTYENQAGDVSGSQQQFGDAGPSSGSTSGTSVFLGTRPNYGRDRYNYDPTYEPRPLPRGAQIGAGDHGFNNSTRYGSRY